MSENEYNKHYSGKNQAIQRRARIRPDINNEQFLANLSTAIRNNELLIHYQPRYDALTGHACYFEALVRWERPGLGTFYPHTFLPAAEAHGLIFALDLWVFEQCCKDLIWLRRNIGSHLKIAVNISSLDCESVYYSQKLIDICSHHNLKLADFELEISESHAINDIRKTIAFCKTLGEYGAQFCLSGFGSGHASLLRLLELPINSIKIDTAFIVQIGESERSEIIIKSLLKLTKALNIKSIANGIEHKYQYNFLIDSGCDLLQGFYFMPPKEKNKINKTGIFITDKKNR